MRISKKSVRFAISGDDPWIIGNQALYDLCRKYPEHKVTAEIVAKVWLIGRAYSASIERGRGNAESSELSNDRFYSEAVPEALRTCGLDEKLKAIANLDEDDEAGVALILKAHACLVQTFHDLTNKAKRSLASKYLHFHLPNFFFIYDSRALSSIRALGIRRHAIKAPRGADREYSQFVGLAIGLRHHVLSEFGEKLSPRQLDRLLLATFASRLA